MFKSVLIANRGEIACRIIRTARVLGIRTIAVHSEADAQALHVDLADEAHCIGPAPARESYLSIQRIIDAARRAGAEAIHPGYGFLSENADFAEACEAAGIVFVGPPPAAMRAMGSKSAAKSLMEKAGVPLVPGYHGMDQTPALLAREAVRIGFPVLIKASAGGGGKGMRVVASEAEFAAALDLARGEARASFGDDQVLVERYLDRPRHIEIQVFADAHGNTVSLFERDCSLQRRHQKVIEEAPAPGMDPAWRRQMGEAACAAARAVGYQGAGTVEFIVQGRQFYFMEMNTRLQVEHPVTEFVTGLDLVEWQFRVAAGQALPPIPAAPIGHAIEARIYAEDPAQNYMPSVGTLHHLRAPAESAHVRVDTGVRAGDAISIHYDPMIAKLIVWDHDRAAALRRLGAALAAYQIWGVRTNLGLLRGIAADPDFARADLDTGFLERHPALLEAEAGELPAHALAAICAQVVARQAEESAAMSAARGDLWSPWGQLGAWRLNGAARQMLSLVHGDAALEVGLTFQTEGGFRMDWNGRSAVVGCGAGGRMTVDGLSRHVDVATHAAGITAFLDGQAWTLDMPDRLRGQSAPVAHTNTLIATMPGRVISVHGRAGQEVPAGEVILVLEAMKVQFRLVAPRQAVIEAVHVAAGDLVDEGAELVRFKEDEAA